MSDLPGLTLEDFLSWNWDVVVDDNDYVNISLFMAESLGTIKPRPRLTSEQFKPVVDLFESYRELVEYRLRGFDYEEHNWRDYSMCFDFIPDSVYNEGARILEALK